MRTETSDAMKLKHIAVKNRWHFYASYSGRGMFGKRCPGIVCPACDAKEVVAAVKRAKIRNGASYDNMGLDMIVYWPSIETDPATFEEEGGEK